MCMVAQAVTLALMKEPSRRTINVLVTAAMILGNLIYGFRTARAKEFSQHKIAMFWACGWTAGPGLLRCYYYMTELLLSTCTVDTIYLAGTFVAIMGMVMFLPV